MSKYGRKLKEAPEGFDYIESTLNALDNELRERVNEPHEGLRKTESQWPVHQINWQKSRYVYDMFYVYHKISREVYEYCIKNKLVDSALIAKWKKPGYERLCSTYVINPRNYKFGTVSICRVPSHCLAPGTYIEDATTGCHGCASGPGGNSNIFGNKYGQYLAAIQVAREERDAAQAALAKIKSENDAEDAESDSDQDDDFGPVAAKDGSSATAIGSIWAGEDEDASQLIPENAIGTLSADAAREARMAIKGLGGAADSGDQSTKRQRII